MRRGNNGCFRNEKGVCPGGADALGWRRHGDADTNVARSEEGSAHPVATPFAQYCLLGIQIYDVMFQITHYCGDSDG